MPLQFIESREEFSLYRDTTTGLLTGLIHNSLTIDGWERLDFDTALEVANEHGLDRYELAALMQDPCEADEAALCEHCSKWVDDNATSVVYVSEYGTEVWCDDCADDDTYQCDRCGERVSSDACCSVGEDTACGSCYSNATGYCDECEVSYWDINADNHDHDDDKSGACCDSPKMSFGICLSDTALDGQGVLRNDEYVTVTLPGGVVSEQGITEIAALVSRECGRVYGEQSAFYPHRQVYAIGNDYKTDKGVFAKRLRAAVYKEHGGYKMPDSVLEKVGTLARKHSEPVDVEISITRDLNQPREEFANEDSCWWSDYSYSRCTLKSNGGFGLRSWDETTWGRYVSGRVWVLPMRADHAKQRLVPTLEEADAYVVFNGYGELGELAGPRVMSALTGWGFSRVTIYGSDWNMYVNGDSGYIVAPEEIQRYRLPQYLDQHADLSDEPEPEPQPEPQPDPWAEPIITADEIAPLLQPVGWVPARMGEHEISLPIYAETNPGI